MQALFFIGLTGFMLAVFSFITTMVAQTALAIKLQNIAQVEELFSDVEFAINKRLLKEYPDFPSYDATWDPEDLLEAPITRALTENTQWRPSQLAEDPWRSPYTVYAASQTIAIGPGVQAPAYAFALVSNGPDRQQDTSLNPATIDYRDTLALEAAAGSDDIVHTFATIDTVRENWNALFQAVEKVKNLLELNYRQQLEQFLPTIDTYYTSGAYRDYIYAGGYTIDETLVAWADGLPSGCSGIACEVPPISTGTAGYPRMPGDLSEIAADKEFTEVLSGFAISLEQENPCTTPVECITTTVRLTSAAPQWTVNYAIEIDGRDLIRER